ncbi:dTDP-4-dehydrorhamnose reductase [Rhodanobacter sp. C01]|uniref:dTDP-4-dehydrorhamnose reductase n=1 Tax=Rhodanobacter sp. C01 TaxID=1945856 RepID=UPI000986A774|nr:dTDP-4-dehydrorhamnose reductase [Rhodanobacter sp. C01]OOG51050.1 dTDP-4-dehydrorhamnose reductase [Rhodanobacter sp. C01]
MKILLLGANGQLGRTFVDHGGLATRGDLIMVTRDGSFGGTDGSCEVSNLAEPATLAALLDRVKPDVVINTAAYTAVDRAEQEEELATLVNGEAVSVLGSWAKVHGALIIHYSTDYVFDGSQSRPYAVNDPTGPLGAYGRSKLAGERALHDSGADHLIFRTAWVYAAHGQNFLRTMLRVGAEREELRVVADQHGAPTSTTVIVEGTLAALDRWLCSDKTARTSLQGVHHLVASGATTWHGFATSIFDGAVQQRIVERAPRITAISTAEFPTPARRPAWSVLDNAGFAENFGFQPPAWQQGLEDVLCKLSASSAK